VFDWLQSEGNLANAEMHRVFNCGIGMVLVVAPHNAGYARERLERSGETVWQIGRIEPRQAGQPQTVVL
jgi:phosphoribosylformylglycinamidine cyclo-ligase